MNVLCVIPARIGSTRLPRKPLALIQGKPMIQRTYEAAVACQDIDQVVVATDSEEVAEVVKKLGATVAITPDYIQTGSDRVAEVAKAYPDYDVVINLQGDEPFMKPEMLSHLVEPYREGQSPDMTTLAYPLDMEKELDDPGIVKVILDRQGYAIYFSRSPIPYYRHQDAEARPLHHIGLYGFRRDFLLQYTQLPATPLEKAESLEQLRAIEHGYKIWVGKTEYKTIEINTPEELAKAQAWVV